MISTYANGNGRVSAKIVIRWSFYDDAARDTLHYDRWHSAACIARQHGVGCICATSARRWRLFAVNKTHIGVGVLDGTLIVGATPAGYEPTPANAAKMELTRRQEEIAKAALAVSNANMR